MKNILFWLVELTWGLLDNFLGLLIFLCLIPFKRPKRFHKMLYFEVGGAYWGGFNCGFTAVVNKNPSSSLLKHEHGHFYQTLMFGPLEPLIQLISAIRYWYRRLTPNKEHKPYDSIWFEGQATRLGEKYIQD